VRRHLFDVLSSEQVGQLASVAERVVEHLGGESVCAAVAREAEGSRTPQLASPE
jgi:hypothetical protein